MIKVVNGFVCASSCDVALARKGIDPKNPHNDPVKAEQLKEQKALAGGKVVDDAPAGVVGSERVEALGAVSFGGALRALNARQPSPSSVAPVVDLLA